MSETQILQRTLTSIDDRGYASYKQLSGRHDLGRFTLSVDKVQVGPFAGADQSQPRRRRPSR